MIEHCIEWGRVHFTENLTDIITDAHKLVTDPKEYYVQLKKEGNTTFQLEKLTHIKELIELSLHKSFDKCIEFAVRKFTENFDYRIQQLLHNFPADYTNKDGSKFWSGSKRVPHPIRYDSKDELSIWFISSYAILLATSLSIENTKDIDYIKAYAAKVNIPDFVPKRIKIKVNDNDNDNDDNTGNIGADEENQLSNLMTELSIYDKSKYDPAIFKPHEFEKDDDTNYHIDFIHACSNLRAENYRITQCDRNKTKMIAGKIIPAIATTTAAITGLVALQIYTLLQTNKMDYMRNVFMNLAVNLFVLTEPSPKIEHRDKEYDPFLLGPVKAVPPNWSVWDKIVVNGPMTIRQFIDHFENIYGVEVSIITCKNITLIQTFQKSNEDRKDKLIEVVYKEHAKTNQDGKKYLILDVSADTTDGAAAIMPLIKYNLN
jgi:ubiquitin-activating enzyme E1